MLRRRLLVSALAAPASQARALMAGVAPDSPQRRLDSLVSSRFACVASISVRGGTYSGVCVAPRFVLTAAHVAGDGLDAYVYLNLGRDLSHRHTVQRVHRHPKPGRIEPGYWFGDLALLELGQMLPAGVELPPLARLPPREGVRIELAGYGGSGPGDQGMTVSSHTGLRRIGANRIDRVITAPGRDTEPLIYLFTFDAPATARREVSRSLGNEVETGLASGDSGSPAFVVEDGRLALLGINTFVVRSTPNGAPTYTFGTISGGEALTAHRDWLRSVLGPGTWPGLD